MRLINKLSKNKLLKGKVKLKLYLGSEDEGYCDFHAGDTVQMVIDVTKSEKLMRGSVSADFMYLVRVVISSPTLKALVETFEADEISFEIFELDDDGYAPDSLGAILQRQKEQNDLVAEVKAQYGDNYALPYLPIKSGTSVLEDPDEPRYEWNEELGQYVRKN